MIISRVGGAGQLWADCIRGRMCKGGSGIAPIPLPARGWISLPRGSFPKADLGAQYGENLCGCLILVLDTDTGRQTRWWWVATEEKQEEMFASGSVSPRSWHRLAPGPAAWLPQLSQLLPCPLGASSLVTPEPGAGSRAGTVGVCLWPCCFMERALIPVWTPPTEVHCSLTS